MEEQNYSLMIDKPDDECDGDIGDANFLDPLLQEACCLYLLVVGSSDSSEDPSGWVLWDLNISLFLIH